MTIVRTPTQALGGVTPAESEALKAHAAKWIANAMSTEPVSPERLVPAIKALYAATGLKEPRIVIVSPRLSRYTVLLFTVAGSMSPVKGTVTVWPGVTGVVAPFGPLRMLMFICTRGNTWAKLKWVCPKILLPSTKA